MARILVFLVSLASVSCAYTFGYSQRDLPGGFHEVAIPVFENETKEVGIEADFTNALIRQFNRSKVAKVVSKDEAAAFIEGKIISVEYIQGGQIDGSDKDKDTLDLPENTVLATDYRVLVTADVYLRRKADSKILWQGQFRGERYYTAPQIGKEIVNSANPHYNHSARLELFANMSKDMMTEAHDQMTENF